MTQTRPAAQSSSVRQPASSAGITFSSLVSLLESALAVGLSFAGSWPEVADTVSSSSTSMFCAGATDFDTSGGGRLLLVAPSSTLQAETTREIAAPIMGGAGQEKKFEF